MTGDKEIWSKAVTLTLLEIARRQRRAFRSICFSSKETPLQVLDMNPRARYEVELEKVMDLAAVWSVSSRGSPAGFAPATTNTNSPRGAVKCSNA